jgi:hypothetical protein
LFLTSRGMPIFTRPRVVHQVRRRRVVGGNTVTP